MLPVGSLAGANRTMPKEKEPSALCVGLYAFRAAIELKVLKGKSGWAGRTLAPLPHRGCW